MCITLQNFVFVLQAYNVKCNTFTSDIPAHYSDISQLPINVNIHDLQRLVMFSGFIRCYFWLFLIWMEEVCCCRCYRTLSLKILNIYIFIYFKMYIL